MEQSYDQRDVISPAEIVDAAEKSGIQKANRNTRGTLVLGFLAGVYISMGGLLSVIVGYGFPEIASANPGIQRLLSGSMFPVGLILVIFAGAELFTGNNATLMPGVLDRKFGWGRLLRNWSLVWISNFAGALFFSYFLVYLTGVMNADPWHSAIIGVAEAKAGLPWHVVFLKGIGANWLVCLAVWLGLSCRSAAGKMIGIWFPVMCFVAIGFEHSIANMFFIPSGIFQGANVGWGAMLWDNLIPATLGHIVGGAFFAGTAYWYAARK